MGCRSNTTSAASTSGATSNDISALQAVSVSALGIGGVDFHTTEIPKKREMRTKKIPPSTKGDIRRCAVNCKRMRWWRGNHNEIRSNRERFVIAPSVCNLSTMKLAFHFRLVFAHIPKIEHNKFLKKSRRKFLFIQFRQNILLR